MEKAWRLHPVIGQYVGQKPASGMLTAQACSSAAMVVHMLRSLCYSSYQAPREAVRRPENANPQSAFQCLLRLNMPGVEVEQQVDVHTTSIARNSVSRRCCSTCREHCTLGMSHGPGPWYRRCQCACGYDYVFKHTRVSMCHRRLKRKCGHRASPGVLHVLSSPGNNTGLPISTRLSSPTVTQNSLL